MDIDRLPPAVAPHRDVERCWVSGDTAQCGQRDDRLLAAIAPGDRGEGGGIAGARLRGIDRGEIAGIAERHG